jgi:hypothetical protein
MSDSPLVIKKINSDSKGIRILVLDANVSRALDYETKTELDPHLQRIEIYTASNLNTARALVKSKRCEIAIFPDRIEDLDFVFIQAEFRNASPKIKLFPMATAPTLAQYRESRRIGGVVDFGDPSILENYEKFRDFLVHCAREYSKASMSLETELEEALQIQSLLYLNSNSSVEDKAFTARICGILCSQYDLNSYEVSRTILAECIYLPTLTFPQYEKILAGRESLDLLRTLQDSASWLQPNSEIKSVQGFCVTASNVLAYWINEGLSHDEITAKVKERPHFIKHIAIRSLNEDIISQVVDLKFENTERKTG